MNTSSKTSRKTERTRIFSTTGSRIILVACALIIAGYVLMSGSGSTESGFCPDVFSARRIVIAPAVCLIGYLLIIVGILRR
jgi:hypothetical protein